MELLELGGVQSLANSSECDVNALKESFEICQSMRPSALSGDSITCYGLDRQVLTISISRSHDVKVTEIDNLESTSHPKVYT